MSYISNYHIKRLKRFKELNRPHNTYCKFDFIDYNGIVDIIYKLSQPYGEENKGGKIKVKEFIKIYWIIK